MSSWPAPPNLDLLVIASLEPAYSAAPAWTERQVNEHMTGGFMGAVHLNHFFGGLVFAYAYERTGTLWPGTILHASAPAAVDGRMQTSARVVDLVHGALAQAVPERVIAACNGACIAAVFSGVHPATGNYYVYLETIGGGFGARATKDGLDGVHVHTTNTSNLPVEGLEPEYPLMVERYELVDDSGGPGRWRGGRSGDNPSYALISMSSGHRSPS